MILIENVSYSTDLYNIYFSKITRLYHFPQKFRVDLFSRIDHVQTFRVDKFSRIDFSTRKLISAKINLVLGVKSLNLCYFSNIWVASFSSFNFQVSIFNSTKFWKCP